MLLGEIIHRDVVRVNFQAKDKDEAIAALVDALVESGDIEKNLQGHVLDVVRAREASMSTGMENGIALPHGSSDKVDRVAGALAVAPEGIPFESLDGKPARLIILLVLPRQKFSSHVRTLASIAHLLNNASFRNALCSAKTVDDVLGLIATEEDKSLFDEYRQ